MILRLVCIGFLYVDVVYVIVEGLQVLGDWYEEGVVVLWGVDFQVVDVFFCCDQGVDDFL